MANYVELKSLVKDEKGNIEGAVLFDKNKNETFKVKTKVLVNCTGVFSDTLRKMNDEKVQSRVLSA